MRWRYKWAALLLPLLAACANSTAATPAAVGTPVGSAVIPPTVTATSIPLNVSPSTPTVTPTVSINPTPTTRVVDPLVQDFVSQLNDLGVQSRLTARSSSYAGCLNADTIGFYGYIAGNGVKYGYGEIFDLRPFGDEQSASAFAGEIKYRGCSGPDWIYELPYFQCGAVIAFVQSTDEDLQTNFEELCGPPFARTRAYSPPPP